MDYLKLRHILFLPKTQILLFLHNEIWNLKQFKSIYISNIHFVFYQKHFQKYYFVKKIVTIFILVLKSFYFTLITKLFLENLSFHCVYCPIGVWDILVGKLKTRAKQFREQNFEFLSGGPTHSNPLSLVLIPKYWGLGPML